MLEAFNKNPCTFIVENVEMEKYTPSEIMYNKYLKSSLGLSKYASSTLALGELGRYPIKFKAIVSSVLFWHRMATGCCNPLLNEAYVTLKEENSTWLNNIKYFLMYHGLGDIWDMPEPRSKEIVKVNVMDRLKDCFIQKYNAYLNDESNVDKCKISQNCCNDDYKIKCYLKSVKSSEIKCYISRLRLDVNATKDCKNRSFRHKHINDNNCGTCHVTHSVAHVLFECKQKNIEDVRKVFMEKYSFIVNDFENLSMNAKLCQILCVKPCCDIKDKEKAVGLICTFIKNVYNCIDIHV